MVQRFSRVSFDNVSGREPVSLEANSGRFDAPRAPTPDEGVSVSKPTHLAATVLLFTAITACSDRALPTQPSLSAAGSVASADKGGTTDRMVSMMDACDHATFAAQNPPILCTRNGGVTFGDLISQLQAHQSAGAWHNAPSEMDARVGLNLLAVNRGGEVHTFTKVAHFGGGIVPPLNFLTGNPVPAPECLAERNFVPPGGSDGDDVVREGTSLYQCCIHPWMRTVVHGTQD
jgi:hypothetical protein